MPTQRLGYFTSDGVRVPSVTTIIGACHLGSIDGLLGWANRLGREGKDHKEERDKAADAGSACHAMVECFKKKTQFDPSQYSVEAIEKATGAYNAFLEWAAQTQLQIYACEQPLVSERYRYGGTLDAILVNGKLSCGDWKTSSGLRVGMLCQIAAYGEVWNENHPTEIITGGYHLIRFSRPEHPDDPVHFSHHYWSELTLAWEAFKRMRELYDIHSRLRRLAA